MQIPSPDQVAESEDIPESKLAKLKPHPDTITCTDEELIYNNWLSEKGKIQNFTIDSLIEVLDKFDKHEHLVLNDRLVA